MPDKLCFVPSELHGSLEPSAGVHLTPSRSTARRAFMTVGACIHLPGSTCSRAKILVSKMMSMALPI